MRIKNLQRALEIISSHSSQDAFLSGADHDVVYLCPEDVPFTDEEKAELDSLGVRLSGEYGCYICHV